MTWQMVGPSTLYLPNASNLTYLDCSGNTITYLIITSSDILTYLDCSGNAMASIDLSANSNLTYFNCSNNNLSTLSLAHITALEELNCLQNNIFGTLDLSNSAGLTTLRANSNNLTSIDLSANTLLTQLQIAANQISSIDFSQNTALLYLDIRWNELTTLDLSHNTALLSLEAGYAPYLTQIDLRNGNNINMPSSGFFTSNSPNLACISVDDTLWANNNTNWRNSSTYIGADPWTLFSADCNAIYGCTDSTATNYNPLANTDDGSCIAVVNGCTDSTATNYNPLANIDDGTCTYPFSGTIGDTLMGGIVFYIFQAGDIGYVAGQVHGLIAAPSDHSTSASWGCDGFLIGATATAIGTGQSNTSTIQAWCSVSSAGQICGNLTLGGNSDWFLPSRDELNKMYVNLHQQNLGSFTNDIYWSSSEYAGYLALYHNFASGYQGDTYKDEHYKVRAVRAF
jgi:hypothetical protein